MCSRLTQAAASTRVWEAGDNVTARLDSVQSGTERTIVRLSGSVTAPPRPDALSQYLHLISTSQDNNFIYLLLKLTG